MWTKWRCFSKEELNNCSESPGVYYIRWIKAGGKAVPIGRLRCVDQEGTLYIGMTGKGRSAGIYKRLWTFWKAVSRKSGAPHSGGKRFQRVLSRHIPLGSLQFCYRRLKNTAQAERVEKECLLDYQKKFWELPPLNSAE